MSRGNVKDRATRGPWHFDPIKEHKLRAPSGRSLGFFEPGPAIYGRGGGLRTHLANKRLIESAPEMRDLLVELSRAEVRPGAKADARALLRRMRTRFREVLD